MRRRLSGIGMLMMLLAFLAPWPASLVLFVAAIVLVLGMVLTRPTAAEIAEKARRTNEDPDLMTVWDVAEVANVSVRSIPRALERDGVPRADAHGWRARLPVGETKLRYRRSDIERWLASRQ